jgi:hypothetical protein
VACGVLLLVGRILPVWTAAGCDASGQQTALYPPVWHKCGRSTLAASAASSTDLPSSHIRCCCSPPGPWSVILYGAAAAAMGLNLRGWGRWLLGRTDTAALRDNREACMLLLLWLVCG